MSIDLAGDVALAAHGVDGDDRARDRHHLQQLGDGADFVALFRHLDVAEHQTLPRREGRDHVDRRLAARLLIGPAHGLAVDGDHLGRRTGQRGDPGDEAALESLGVERRENVAQLIVRWRPVAKRPEPAQEFELLFAEPGDNR